MVYCPTPQTLGLAAGPPQYVSRPIHVGLNLPNMCCSHSITFGTNLSLILHMLPHLLVCQIHHSPEPIGRASNSLEPFGKQHSVLSTQMQKATLSSFGQGVSGQDGGRLSAISLRGKCTLRRYFCNSPQCLRFSKKNLNL